MRKHWRIVFRVVGILLLLFGLYASYWWFYKMAPARCTLDPQWFLSYSQQEHWREVQEGIHRGTWFHDDGFYVGWYGDKSWAEWIMQHVKPGESMYCLGSTLFHSSTAMNHISNQDVGKNADDWLEWWEKNKSKSQEQWIEEGFAQRGVKVDVPPSEQQRPLLIALLAKSDPNNSSTFDGVKYNAFRCLRDSGFDPVEFAFSHATASDEIKRGLQEYMKLERRFPAALRLGILPFAKKEEDWKDYGLPPILTTKYQAIAYASSVGSLLLGTGLIFWSLRRKKGCVKPN